MYGAGPAGAAASLLLASWGHDVTLFRKQASDHRLAVSLPPSCAKLFEAIGVGEDVDRAGFIRSTGNTVWWGKPEPRLEYFAAGARGWQLDVHELAQLIADKGARAGLHVEPSTDRGASGAFILDCTGRSGLVARAKQLREYETGPRTIALVGEWRRDRWDMPDESHTLIESYQSGWMWSVPTRRGTRHIAAMVDPQRSELSRNGPSTHVYLAEIRKTRVFSTLVDGAEMSAGPWGWDASAYHSREYAGDGWLLVGDAGSFIDPLSSAGVKKALASAWLAAIVAHTCVTKPSMASHALQFFSDREREIAAHLTNESRRFLADAAAGHDHPFWDEREEVAPHADRKEIREAFERLKGEAAFRAQRSEALTIEPRPCINGREIVLEPHIVNAGSAATRYVNNVDAVALIELSAAAVSVPDLYEAYCRRCGPAALPDFLLALATAFANRWLVSE